MKYKKRKPLSKAYKQQIAYIQASFVKWCNTQQLPINGDSLKKHLECKIKNNCHPSYVTHIVIHTIKMLEGISEERSQEIDDMISAYIEDYQPYRRQKDCLGPADKTLILNETIKKIIDAPREVQKLELVSRYNILIALSETNIFVKFARASLLFNLIAIGTGMRRASICGIRWCDITFHDPTDLNKINIRICKFKGKLSKKIQFVEISFQDPTRQKLIHRLLLHHALIWEKSWDSTEYVLFPGIDEKKFPNRLVTFSQYLTRILKISTKKNITPHSFRSEVISQLISKDIPEKDVKAFVHHSLEAHYDSLAPYVLKQGFYNKRCVVGYKLDSVEIDPKLLRKIDRLMNEEKELYYLAMTRCERQPVASFHRCKIFTLKKRFFHL